MHSTALIVLALFGLGFFCTFLTLFLKEKREGETVSVDSKTIGTGLTAAVFALGFIAVGVHGIYIFFS